MTSSNLKQSLKSDEWHLSPWHWMIWYPNDSIIFVITWLYLLILEATIFYENCSFEIFLPTLAKNGWRCKTCKKKSWNRRRGYNIFLFKIWLARYKRSNTRKLVKNKFWKSQQKLFVGFAPLLSFFRNDICLVSFFIV